MNRRQAILGGVTVFGLGFSIFKWGRPGKRIDLSDLEHQKKLIEELAECIIPETDTPGAKTAGLQDFVVKAVYNCENLRNQRNFIDGLQDLEDYAINHFKKSFIHCSPKDKKEILSYFDQQSRSFNLFFKKAKRKILGDPFFYLLKKYIVIGYCTSIKGANQGLAYDYIPSTYESCTNILKDQKSWATK
ncbi:gluconate 2-dehydrogenase subunit 3 family protein [Pedobacter nutrimenti]|uniref:Gluconate 2-dehydrogenase subunit 3-like protein n=1 Tax=Pedobacter nutrimenti TaxID=1241337 RepID=A0A318UKF3_9SPHI|nr:gluconate 2-dehydrogenase subunit 3 family protein [Pedobacter nutrimenti]PYF76872.1 gluconate 2-dehydrogenase subunit 3-like protein [Pedobacter nutrimenti]